MRILLVEDEHYAAKRLVSLLKKELPNAEILAILDTVEETCAWLASHPEPGLIFMDIQLADGLSFQIFDKVKVECPVIFTTAYDEYALDAFKVNSIALSIRDCLRRAAASISSLGLPLSMALVI